MLKLQKVRNGNFEEESALINVDTKEVIARGDYYHDKINEYINGILHGITYSGVIYEELESVTVTPDMELFDICDFYNEDDEFTEEDEEYSSNEEDDNIEEAVEEVKPETKEDIIILPHQAEHGFKIYGEETRYFYGNVIEALNITRNNEADLFCEDKDFHEGIVYSCLGLDDECNNDLLKPFGVYYDENNKLQILE